MHHLSAPDFRQERRQHGGRNCMAGQSPHVAHVEAGRHRGGTPGLDPQRAPDTVAIRRQDANLAAKRRKIQA
jgi:hypothetical protein